MRILGRIKGAMATVLASVMAFAPIAAATPTVALADSARTVTMGVDLSPEQRGKVLSFFGLTEDDLNQMDVINVNNQDERRYLEGTLSDDIIGWKTYSCSYIQPRTSGGLRVETANLTYVTKNTLYNALQTAGVENCSLVVTAPFPVSGTGALTGVFMAYEKRGVKLDEQKKDAATTELVKTAALEETYGEDVAEVISDVKNKVVSERAELSDDDIRGIISTAAKLRGIDLTEEDINTILGIIDSVRGLNYDLDAFSNTLEDFKNQLAGLKDQIEENKNLWEQFLDWLGSVIEWFKGLLGMAPAVDESTAVAQDDLISDLNTDVFKLDDPGSQATGGNGSSTDVTATSEGTSATTTTEVAPADAEPSTADTAEQEPAPGADQGNGAEQPTPSNEGQGTTPEATE